MTELHAGFARRDITPELGMPNSTGVECVVTEIWDPLYATALVLDDGQTKAVVIGADLCAFLQQVDTQIRHAVAQALTISADQIVLNASHTHSAPYLATEYADLLHPYGLKVTELAYVRYVQDQIVAAAREASASAIPVQLRFGRAIVERVASNRRLRMSDGTMISRHGRPLQALRDLPEGLIDPEVRVVSFVDGQGQSVGFIVNYACHPTAAGGDLHGWVSADFVGYGLRSVEAAFGGALALFLQGTAGNVGTGKWIDSTPRGDAEAMGNRLAAGIMQARLAEEPVRGDQLHIVRRHVPLQLEPFPELAEMEQLLVAAAAIGSHSVVAAGDAWAIARRFADFQQAPISALKVGTMVIAFLPGELFVEFGLQIQRESKFCHTIVSAYNDDSLQYIPTKAAFDEGAYEVNGGWCYAKAGDGETLTQGSLRLLNELYDV